uniref:hypothetical protein n=1 Tax=Caballeronia sp. INML3 TaxID=2921752 RepID=UPI0020324CDE
ATDNGNMASNVNLYNRQNDKSESEAAKKAKELRKILDTERAALGQKTVQKLTMALQRLLF